MSASKKLANKQVEYSAQGACGMISVLKGVAGHFLVHLTGTAGK